MFYAFLKIFIIPIKKSNLFCQKAKRNLDF